MLEKIRHSLPGHRALDQRMDVRRGSRHQRSACHRRCPGHFRKSGLGAAANWPLNLGPSPGPPFGPFATSMARAHLSAIPRSRRRPATTRHHRSMPAPTRASRRVVVLAINKESSRKVCGDSRRPRSFVQQRCGHTLTAAAPKFVPAAPLTATASNAFLYSMPARSISVLVLAP